MGSNDYALYKSTHSLTHSLTARPKTQVVSVDGCCGLLPLAESLTWSKKGKGSPYSTAERRVRELIPVLGSQPAGDMSHKPGGRLPLLSARPAVTLATLKRAATNVAAW